MTDRPAILTAKVDRQASIIADADDLKRTPKSERPNSATMDDVRAAYANAMRDLKDTGSSVAAVEHVDLPSGRL